jgi:hypothetical protein
VQAEIENPRLELFASNFFTIVVFPEPDGAENIINLPSKVFGFDLS